MKTIARKSFETVGENTSDIVKHVNDITTYPTTVLHTRDDGETETVNTREICITEGREAAADVVQSVLNTQRGEMQFDVTRGIPYLETIFSHPDRLMEWEVEMREAIESLPFVDAIESFESAIERENVAHRDTQLKVRYSSRIRTNLEESESEVELKDGRTVNLQPFPVAPAPNWRLQKDSNSTEFTVKVKAGDCLILRVTCDTGALISWDDDSQDFSIVGKVDSTISHTYEKTGTFRVAVGSGITDFQVQPNSLVVSVDRYNTVIKSAASMFRDSTELVEVCEWAAQIEDISYCYSGCEKLKGVKQSDGTYTLPVFTDSITECTYAYENCLSLCKKEDGSDYLPASRTSENRAALDAIFMPSRIHEAGGFYNCYYGANVAVRRLVFQSWGGLIIDFSDDRYCTDFTCTGNAAFKVSTNMRSYVRVYDKGEGASISDTDPFVSETSIAEDDTPVKDKVVSVSVSGTKRVRFPIGVVAVAVTTSAPAPSKTTTVSVNSYSATLTNLDDALNGVTSLQRACSFPASIKSALRCYMGCTSLKTVTGLDGTDFWKNIALIEDCFSGCTSLTVSGRLSPFPSAVTSVNGVFRDCSSLTGDTPAIGGGIVSAVETFKGCTKIGASQSKLSWGGALLNLKYCYKDCKALGSGAGAGFSIPDTGSLSVVNMTETFSGCTGLKCNLPLPSTRKVVLVNCFKGCTGLTLGTTDAYKYDNSLMPSTLRNLTYEENGNKVDFGTGSSVVHTGYVADCSTAVRTAYIASWGGLRPNSSSAAASDYPDYTELFVGTSNREGAKIASLAVGLQFSAKGTFVVTGLGDFPHLVTVSNTALIQYLLDTRQKFGTSSNTGVSVATIRIHNVASGKLGNTSAVSQLRIYCPFRTKTYAAQFTNRGSTAPSSPAVGDYYCANGLTYVYSGTSWDSYNFPSISASDTLDAPGQYRYNSSTRTTTLLDYGDLCFSLQNVNRFASTITSLQSAFRGAENLGNCAVFPASLTNAAYCYSLCTNLVGVTGGGVPAWPSSLATAAHCYDGCSALVSSAERLPDFPSTCTSAEACYRNCSNDGFTSLPGNWGGVQNASYCYYGCTNLGAANSNPSVYLPEWRNVRNASYCYYGCSLLYAVMPVWPTFVNNATYNFAYCYYGCSSLLPNEAFQLPRTAMPVQLGGGKSDSANRNQHHDCVAGCSDAVRAQFLSTWGGNFQFSALTLKCATTKSVTASLYFGLSVENAATDDITITLTTGAQRKVADANSQILFDHDGDYGVPDGTEITDDDGERYLVAHTAQSFANLCNSKCVVTGPLNYSKTSIQGTILVQNADYFKWGAYKQDAKAGTTTYPDKSWTSVNGTLTPPAGSLQPKMATDNPFRAVVTEVTDTERGSVLCLGYNSFEQFSALTKVSIPNLISVGLRCFFKCEKLTSLSLPGLLYTSTSAFQNCTGLASVSLPSLVTVGKDAFNGCKNITSFSLPSVTTIGEGAFTGCAKLQRMTFGEVSTFPKNSLHGVKSLRNFSLEKGDDVYTTFNGQSISTCGNSKTDGSQLCDFDLGLVNMRAGAFFKSYVGTMTIANGVVEDGAGTWKGKIEGSFADGALSFIQCINGKTASTVIVFSNVVLFKVDESAQTIRPLKGGDTSTANSAAQYNMEDGNVSAIDAITFLKKVFAKIKIGSQAKTALNPGDGFVQDALGHTMTITNSQKDAASAISKNTPKSAS